MRKLIRFPGRLPPDPLAGCHLIVDTQAAPERRIRKITILRLTAAVIYLAILLALCLGYGWILWAVPVTVAVIFAGWWWLQ